ncbi:MAG: hypothetical protein U9O85_05010 [Euryarchaeota archaeon]|nr:hypothetical protein [Euryarchaeota archaeon]
MTGVIYPDEYAVEEAFQLLKVPWAWYDSSKDYGVVIAKRVKKYVWDNGDYTIQIMNL